jgi:hypothetical protein
MNTNERSNEMNIPGFTAEASVYKNPGNYQMAGTPNDLAGNRGVVPQMSAPCWKMYRNCFNSIMRDDDQEAGIWCTVLDVFC